jgi:beta-phosphoglucomutase-like phosphatase (HAD superfamily)
VQLPYEEQFTWGITRLRPEQLALCIEESHSDERILASEPYPGAVEALRAWHAQGHFLHVTSHREGCCREATSRWLEGLGVPFDDLHCSYDKVSRCTELQIDLIIDDSPLNISAALEAGMIAATIEHPWNRDVCEEEDVIGARDWEELTRRLESVLNGKREQVAGAPSVT